MGGLLSIPGDLETFLADDLYPYRYALGAIAVALSLAALFLAYRFGAHRILMRHRLASTLIGVPLLVVAVVVGNYLFSPLWERSHLDEASPLAVDAAPAAGEAVAMDAKPAFQPRTTHSGMFKGADDFHFGRGDALIVATGESERVLRFENFSVRNGPDLYVYLSKDENGKRVDEMLNLGKLKATDGAFNYEIPPGIDLTGVKSVVVWCRQFEVQFAVAPLKLT